MSEKDNASKRKLSWKRAFHLLKCVALRKFRLNHHENNEPIQSNNYFKERIIYPKGTNLITSRNDGKMYKFETNTYDENLENLAKTVVTGIVEEIKSRSGSASSKSITPPIDPIKNEPLIIRPEKFKFSLDNTPVIKKNNFRPRPLVNSKVTLNRPSIVIPKIKDSPIIKNPKSKDIKHPDKEKLELITQVLGEDLQPDNQENILDLNINPLRSHRPSLDPIKESNNDLTQLLEKHSKLHNTFENFDQFDSKTDPPGDKNADNFARNQGQDSKKSLEIINKLRKDKSREQKIKSKISNEKPKKPEEKIKIVEINNQKVTNDATKEIKNLDTKHLGSDNLKEKRNLSKSSDLTDVDNTNRVIATLDKKSKTVEETKNQDTIGSNIKKDTDLNKDELKDITNQSKEESKIESIMELNKKDRGKKKDSDKIKVRFLEDPEVKLKTPSLEEQEEESTLNEEKIEVENKDEKVPSETDTIPLVDNKINLIQKEIEAEKLSPRKENKEDVFISERISSQSKIISSSDNKDKNPRIESEKNDLKDLNANEKISDKENIGSIESQTSKKIPEDENKNPNDSDQTESFDIHTEFTSENNELKNDVSGLFFDKENSELNLDLNFNKTSIENDSEDDEDNNENLRSENERSRSRSSSKDSILTTDKNDNEQIDELKFEKDESETNLKDSSTTKPRTNKSTRIFSPILFSYKRKDRFNSNNQNNISENSSDMSSLSSSSTESLNNLNEQSNGLVKNDNILKMSDEVKSDENPVESNTTQPDEINSEQLDTGALTTNQPEIAENGDISTNDNQPTDENQQVDEQNESVVETNIEVNVETRLEEDNRKNNAKKIEEKPKKPKKVEVPKMDPNFYYDYESMVFKPVISEESNLNENFLQLFHSFGYDCKKRSNLHLIDEETLIFSAGNVVELLNIRTREQRYLKTVSGGAVGAISVHPSRKYFAVGEKGNVPNINIFEYPSLKLHRILRQGTIKGYAYLDYDPAGNLLASLGSAPDYMLTIWDWREEKVVLRTKAFSQDIFKVTFSKDLEGILTSAGTGHIKFWKMASTFTGFKLQGDIGKFGKTEISDIEGYAELPDGKVLSGSEWGNMLLWDGGLIQTEICRKKNKSCHTGSIQQITLNEGDIYTVGDDGSIRVWDFETIDASEPSEEGVKLEIEPLNELKVGNNVALRSMVKDFSEESTIWYAQDSNGAIWKLDLGFSATSEDPKQLFNYHSGCINGIECCPISHLFATTADDGSVKVYDYLNYDILCQKKFTKSGTALKWLNPNIDPDGGTIVAGFKDGVLRFMKLVPKNDKFELVLFEVFKPHTQAITRIAIDSKNSLIATGSDDQTVFFFTNKQNSRTPIGFVNLPSKVTYMTWTPSSYEKNRLLVCMENGAAYEFDAPVPDSYDISKTYLIELKLKCRKYQFKSMKSFYRHEEELERKRKEEEERKKKELEERRLRGIDEEEEKKKKKEAEKKAEQDADKNMDEENDESKKPKEDEWKPYIPETPSKICWALYSSPDTFWLSMDAYDAGYLYECKFLDEAQKAKMSPEKIDEPLRGVPVIKSDLTHAEDIPLTCINFDNSKNYAIIGEKNGLIRINPLDESKKIENIKHYWSYGYHDTDYGHVTHVSLSYNEKFLFSVGADSNIFGILFNSSLEDLEKAKAEKIKVTYKVPVQDAVDIDDPQAYSIEQAKQKSEHDKMISIAEAKKAEMRQKINGLRKMFKDLSTKNDQLVPRLKLNKDEFLLEESIKQQVVNQINEKIDITYRELAWNSEKCRLMLEKVQSTFKDVIDCDHVIVHSFDHSVNVSTFRTVALPKDMEAYKAELEKQYYIKLLEKQKTKENLDNQGLLDLNSDESENGLLQGQSLAEQMKKIFGKLRGNTAAKVERALKKMDERRMKRLKRKREWQDLMKSKLPDDYENPDDLANIKHAEETLGDFKLKSSDDYVVSENERMNVYKAVERLMMIKNFINKNQMIFNKKVLSLRDKKKGLVEEINRAIDRLEQIQYILGQEQEISIPRPSMRPEEIPEKKYEYTREKLIEFKKELESKQNKSHEEDGSGGGFGGFSSSNNAPSAQKKIELKSNDKKSKLEGLKPLWHNKDTMSNLMKQQAQAKEIRLHYEQKQILKSIEEKIRLFDAELKVLRHDKARVSIYMKNADLRHVTIFEEFLLLREFEKTENELEQKLSMKKDEHLDMQAKLAEIQSKIDLKKKDIDKIDENLKHLFQSYTQMTHDETKYGDFLNKVYKRKIKRKKKVEGMDEDEESEEESEDEDDDDEDLDMDDDDSEAEGREQLDLDICPSGLKQELFDQVCQLREKRLDFEEQIAEEKKILEQFKKDQDGLIKKGKLVEGGLRQAQTELENFQKEKQKKINSLDIVVTLRLSQIQFLNKGRLPADLSEALAFDAKNLDRLQSRIKELEVEKAAEKKLFKNLKERHHELIRDKKKMDEYVGKLDELCNKMMLDKYGKIVDLEKIELIAVNQQIEELKQRMAENESEHEKVMKEWLDKINSEKDESIELLKANTIRINEMVELLSESKKLESTLDNKQRSLGQEMTSTSKKELEERRRLHTLVQLQAQEIEALKSEISILSRKGGHILPPTQPIALTQQN
ncbi:unnamed protein product [Brachionus calyciflorus]|uniref:Cilia- and flagella-associated protein 44 n=1 Tax=Brachionus calyciflorus TaxID=104777 RepID=A0A813M927_9BILA|nr:unnamed protein product [Brachionus calyciflorus]